MTTELDTEHRADQRVGRQARHRPRRSVDSNLLLVVLVLGFLAFMVWVVYATSEAAEREARQPPAPSPAPAPATD